MAYQKQTWVNDVTDVDATHMNHIEDGIEEVDQRVDNTNEFIIKKVVELLEVGSAPITCVEGDKYFNTTTNKIYTATATNTWGTTGEDAQKNAIYYVINTKKSYAYNGTTLINIGDVGGINVVNEESQSTTDTYSCDYVNQVKQDLEDKIEDVYSTSEVKTNKVWIDGKPIYKKVIHKSNVGTGYHQYNHDISNLGTLISATGSISYIFSNNARQDAIPNVVADNITGWGASILNIENTKFALLLGTSYPTTNEIYVILEYTKTTD